MAFIPPKFLENQYPAVSMTHDNYCTCRRVNCSGCMGEERTIGRQLLEALYADGAIRDYQGDPDKNRPNEGEVAVTVWFKAGAL